MARPFNRALKLCGEPHRVGTIAITVLEYDVDSRIVRAKGATVPTDGVVGYAKGCEFVRTGGGVATTLYINEGSLTSADFNAMETSASTITGVVAGAGMTGGGTEGTVTLDVVNTDGKITVGANSIDITADKLVNADINSAAAIALSKLAAIGAAKIIVGAVTTGIATAVDLSGDATISNIGALTIANAAVNQAKLKYETASVTVAATASTGTAAVTAGSIILGYYPTGNQDQLVDGIAIAETTLTITLAAAATADNTFNVICLKA